MLDFKTNLYLYVTGAKKVEHPDVKEEKLRTVNILNSKKNEVYVFKNKEEYRNYFLMFLDDVTDDLIDLAIYTRGKDGQIVALSDLCRHIIIKKKTSDFYKSITQEQVDKIHNENKLTPLELVQSWESYDLCVPTSGDLVEKNRCIFFEHNCHDCLMEYASHSLEKESFNFKIVNSLMNEDCQNIKINIKKNKCK